MNRSIRLGVLAAGSALLVALSLLLLPMLSAEAVTGSPAITVVLAQNGQKIDVSGVYSDPTGVCVISGKTVNIVVRANNAGGAILKTFTSTTDALGAYGPTTTPGGSLGPGTYYVQVSVAGSLSGGYGAGDACPNVTNNATIVLT